MTASRPAETRRSSSAPPNSRRVVSLPTAPSSDEELVARLVAREPRAVAELYDRFAQMVRGVLVRTLGDATDADDLMQETFLVVLRRARDILNPSALRSFVMGTALRTARNELRKRAVRRFVGLEDPRTAPLVAPHDAVLGEKVRSVYSALDRMDAESRTLFVLRHVEGLELAELAEVKGCSLATIKRRLARVDRRFQAIVRRDPVLGSSTGRSD